MIRFLYVALALSACVPTAPQPAEPPPPDIPAGALSPVATLAGEWRVAGIDGQGLNESYGIALSASEKEIWWSPRCAGFARSYVVDGHRFASGPLLDSEPRQSGESTAPACLIALPAKVGAVFNAIDAGSTIKRTAANGVEISGGGHALLLFSQ